MTRLKIGLNIYFIGNKNTATTGLGKTPTWEWMEIPFSFMNDDEKSKHEIKIHNPWSDTTIRTYDLKVAAAHLIYKSHRAPPSAVHRHIELTIGGVKYDVQPKPFPMPHPGGVSIDDVLQKIVEEIRYCVDLHDAMYVD